MPNHRTFIVLEFHGQDVKAAGDVEKLWVFGQITQGHFSNLTTLGGSYGFLREAKFGMGAGFHFDKDQNGSVVSNNIDFPTEKAISPLQEAKSFLGEKADGLLLAAAA